MKCSFLRCDVELCVCVRTTIWLSTAPTQPLTHWYQVRCLLQTPLFVKQGQTVIGKVHLKSNKRSAHLSGFLLLSSMFSLSSFLSFKFSLIVAITIFLQLLKMRDKIIINALYCIVFHTKTSSYE